MRERGSGEAEGAWRGGEGADRCGDAVEGGVSKWEEEEEEEDHPQQVGGQDCYAVGVFQRCADSRETHVVTEGVAEDWTHQVTCNTEDEEVLTLTSIQERRIHGTTLKLTDSTTVQLIFILSMIFDSISPAFNIHT